MEQFSLQNAIRLQFECLVKRVIDTTVKDYDRTIGRRANHEIPFADLPEIDLIRIGTMDEYELDSTCFEVKGEAKVKVYSEQLANALQQLPEKKRNIILMFYFLEISDREIAELLSVDRSTTFRNRKSSLEEMKKIMKGE